MPSVAGLGVLAVMCTLLLSGVAEQVEVHDLAETYLPSANSDAGAQSSGGKHPNFRLVPGDPAGSLMYQKIQGSTLEECNTACNEAELCTAFRYDKAFSSCELLKLDDKKLERATTELVNNAVATKAEMAKKEADKMVAKDQKAEAKKEQAEAKLDAEAISTLTKKPSARDVWRKAVRFAAKKKEELRAVSQAANEAKLKVGGTNTVERVVKRHVNDVASNLAGKHKALYAATLNMEEQMMIRPNPEAKEVILAQGARESAELKYNKARKAHLESQKMEKKAQEMATNAVEADAKAVQMHVEMRLSQEKAAKDLKKATVLYRAEEVKQKNASDLKKEMAASREKTFLKMRSEKQERLARSASEVVDENAAEDRKVLADCEAEQQRVKQVEARLKEQVSQEESAKAMVATTKKIADFKRLETARMQKKIDDEKQELVAKVKKGVSDMVETMMQTMSSEELLATHEKLLGESASKDSLNAVSSSQQQAKSDLDLKVSDAKTAQTTYAARKKSTKQAMEKMNEAVKKLRKAPSKGFKAARQRKKLKQEILKRKVAVQRAGMDEKVARNTADSARRTVAEAQLKVNRLDAEQHDLKVKASLQAVMEKKEVLLAEQKAAAHAASLKSLMLKKVNAQAAIIRQQEVPNTAAAIKTAWEKKKASLGIKIVDCKNPISSGDKNTELDKLKEQAAIAQLQPAKAPTDLEPVSPVLRSEIEKNVKRATEADMQIELSNYKKKIKAKMNEQLATEKKLLRKEKEELEHTADKTRTDLLNELSKPALEKDPEPVKKPGQGQGQ